MWTDSSPIFIYNSVIIHVVLISPGAHQLQLNIADSITDNFLWPILSHSPTAEIIHLKQ